MNSKKVLFSAVVLLCSLCFASVTYAQQRLWGVSVNGELFSMNADGSDMISASSFGSNEYGYTVAGFSESQSQDPRIPTNLVFTTRNSVDDWILNESYGKVVRITPSGLVKSNYFRERHSGAAHGITDGLWGGMHTALIGPDNKWAGFLVLGPGLPDGWYEGVYKPNKDYSKEYYLTTYDSVIYGVSRGDSNNNGFLYKISAGAHELYYEYPEKFYSFNNAADGLRPTGRLSVGQGVTLFGYTLKGGVNGKGTFYKVNRDGTGFEKLFDLANKALTKTESDGKYQTLLDVVAAGYLPATDSQGNYLVHDATGIYRVAPTGYLISKISSIHADRIALITPKFQHHVKVTNINNGATGVSSDVILQLNEFTGSNGYQLQLSTSSDFSSGVTTLNSDDNIISVNDLGAGTTYYTRARAKSWPYYGEVVSFTCSQPVVDTRTRVYGQRYPNSFSLSPDGGDKFNFKYRYAPDATSMLQLANGDKLVIGYEWDAQDTWYHTTLYRLSPDGLHKLYRLDYMDDTFIESTIVEGDDGWIYSGNFSQVGPQFYGFIRFKSDGSAWEEVHLSHPDFLRSTKLVKTPEGIIGNSTGRQGNLGFLYRIRPDFSGMDIVYQFSNGAAEGARPEGKMVYYNGWIYGTTRIAGAASAGTIFKVRPDGTDYTVIHHFSPTFGKNPVGLVQDSNGTLYGATELGGKNGKGIIYKINPDGTGFQKIYEYWTHFTGAVNSKCQLAVDDQYVYSLTDDGSLFRIKKDGSGYWSFGEVSYSVDAFPTTQTNAQVLIPADLSEGAHINPDIIVSTIAGAASYTLQYSKFSDFSDATTMTSDTTTFNGFTLSPGTTYFARVRTSLTPAWGPTTTFATASAQALTVVISPQDGTVDVGIYNPDDEWNNPLVDLAIQPLPGADFYRVQVSLDSVSFAPGALVYDNWDYGGNYTFNADGQLGYYGQWLYARAKTDLSTEWGPTTRFRMIELPEYPSTCEYTVSPNPSENVFTFAYTGSIRAVYVRDFLGELVYKNEDLNGVDPIRFGEGLAPGIYIMTVVTHVDERVMRLVKE